MSYLYYSYYLLFHAMFYIFGFNLFHISMLYFILSLSYCISLFYLDYWAPSILGSLLLFDYNLGGLIVGYGHFQFITFIWQPNLNYINLRIYLNFFITYLTDLSALILCFLFTRCSMERSIHQLIELSIWVALAKLLSLLIPSHDDDRYHIDILILLPLYLLQYRFIKLKKVFLEFVFT